MGKILKYYLYPLLFIMICLLWIIIPYALYSIYLDGNVLKTVLYSFLLINVLVSTVILMPLLIKDWRKL